MAKAEVTVGIDIGTSSVKAVAADSEGNILSSARIPHDVAVRGPSQFEHDASIWRRGPHAAIEVLAIEEAAGVSVGAMVPSLAPVDESGVPIGPGLLYGDEHGNTKPHDGFAERGELAEFLAFHARESPEASGYWPAQAVANYALAGRATISTTVAATAVPLFDWAGWDETLVREAGARVEQLPDIRPSMQPVGEVPDLGGAVLEGGTIDALGEQIVAGADRDGDVLVICGTTLIVWVVGAERVEVAGYYSVPHTTAGRWLFGGPSNGGGLFIDWARRLAADGAAPTDPARIPLWVPYPRGERVPLADPSRRAELFGLDLTHDAAAVSRAAYEAAGFVVRRMIEASRVDARRIVAVGGGVLVPVWMQALADCTGLPVDVSATSHGGALGCAYLARVAAGLEADASAAGRWARTARTVEPDPAWLEPCAQRYAAWSERAS